METQHRAQQHAEALGNSRLAREIEGIVLHVMATRRKGRREAARLVGRRLTPETLANWRVYGMFPVGFRNGSKAHPARVRLDGGTKR